MKEFDVKDPDTGGSPPGGASGDTLPVNGGTVPHGAAHRGGAAGAVQEGRHAPDNRPRGKKRRKRRRGRKVFARDGAGMPKAEVAPSQAIGRALDTPSSAGSGQPVREANSARRWRDENPAKAGTMRSIGDPALDYTKRGGGGHPERTGNGDAPVFAALDLGTNNCRLLVAIPTRPGQFRVIDAFSRIVRLGEGLSTSGRLGRAAMDRAIDALKVCADKLASRHVRHSRLIATEACRSAENGPEFLSRVKDETGLELEVIDRETEARLAVSGCGSLVERGTDGVVLFDIGGGSSEVALIDVSGPRSPRLAEHIVAWTSLPVGVVSLAERFGGRDVTPQSFRAMVDHVASLLLQFEKRHHLSHLASGTRFHLLGTSGTVTTLAGVHLGLDRYDRRRVDGLWMSRSNVDAMVERLLSWDFPARVANPCIGADRADLVLGGCAILEAIRAVWPTERLRVADRGLREGILSELMGEVGVWRSERRGVRQ
ncbi:Ppx/GppA phosphatase family protein [Mesorhizobium sp. BAC0120]|uniref:Ppx/GppA phosphatase family protein n=1 Tax=Mesorhizobium sp. BAC0120 TaxID=3090670 RepID=UPI00298CBEFF|nr:Ppx/GppA phosphatase family protein [Mesorhizobium sp. BAC0120]MDW6023154.1 Ppx/GppA phosphatase family protein [Mesorhizobium sp. BAC0120]